MNFNEMQNLWNSPRNRLPTAAQKQLADQFARQMIRRRRFQTVWLLVTFVGLTAVSILAFAAIGRGKANLEQEWGLFPMLIVPWAFALHFLRRHLKPVSPTVSGEMSIVESVRAALASNREAQSRLKRVGALYGVLVPFLVIAMRQLHGTGKVSERELFSMACLFGLVLVLGALGMAARYFARLKPEQRELNSLLSEISTQP